MRAKGQAPRFAIRSRLIKVLPMSLNKNSRNVIFRHSNVGIESVLSVLLGPQNHL